MPVCSPRQLQTGGWCGLQAFLYSFITQPCSKTRGGWQQQLTWVRPGPSCLLSYQALSVRMMLFFVLFWFVFFNPWINLFLRWSVSQLENAGSMKENTPCRKCCFLKTEQKPPVKSISLQSLWDKIWFFHFKAMLQFCIRNFSDVLIPHKTLYFSFGKKKLSDQKHYFPHFSFVS